MTVTVYGIPNCDQIRKTRAWLDQHGIDYRFHDYRKEGLDAAPLQDWVRRTGLDTLINRRGTTWRRLDATQQAAAASPATAIALLQAHPALIKRPVITTSQRPDALQVGFSDEALRSFLLPA